MSRLYEKTLNVNLVCAGDPQRFFYDDDSVALPNKHPNLRPLLSWFTSLHLDNSMSIQQCIDTLCQASSLIHCRFGNITEDTAVSPIIRATIPALQALHLSTTVTFADREGGFSRRSASNDSYLCQLFGSIKTPSLRHLSVQCNSQWRQDSFLSFLEASNIALEALEFKDVRMSDDELLHILRLFPGLRALKFHAFRPKSVPLGSRHLVEYLTYSPEAPLGSLVAPKLEMISFNAESLVGIRDGCFGNMIRSRTLIPCPEKPLEVIWYALQLWDTKHEDKQILHTAAETHLRKLIMEPLMLHWGYEVRQLLWPFSENDPLPLPGWKKNETENKVYFLYSDLSLDIPKTGRL